MKRLVTAFAVPVALALCMSAAWAGAPSPDALLSDADRRHQEQSLQNALEFNRTGEAEIWENAETGHWGTVTPTLTYRNAAGQDCRKFERAVIIDNRQAQVWSTRCRTAAGVWLQPVAPKPVHARVYQDHRHHFPHPRPYPYYRAASIILFYGIGHDRPRRYHRHDRSRRHDRLHRRGRPHRHDRLHRHDRADRHDRLHRRERPHRHDRLRRHDRADRRDRHHRHDRADRRGRR
ncbi:MAG: RT0821/Lpp0805 family surface protein [Deltaproteobacteria bacterium]|nr:RT0821/Lpp0805 family surface protein [Deltaproteobacteria bacterium]